MANNLEGGGVGQTDWKMAVGVSKTKCQSSGQRRADKTINELEFDEGIDDLVVYKVAVYEVSEAVQDWRGVRHVKHVC